MITLTESERLRARVVGALDRPTYHYWKPTLRGAMHALCGHPATDHEPAIEEPADLCVDCERILSADGWTKARFDALYTTRGASC